MKYKQFYRELINEVYPNGGFKMTQREADIFNTNRKVPVDEGKPCWDGYVQYGMKMKNGKQVPNCIPQKSEGIFDARDDAMKPLAKKKTEPDASASMKATLPKRPPLSDEQIKALAKMLGTKKETHVPEYSLDETDEYCPHCLKEVIQGNVPEQLGEAEYQGRKVQLGKPMRGDVKKFKVFVKDPKTGNVKKVNFGDKTMRIKKSNPARRKSFRARHNCASAKDRTSARYWSCKKW